MMVQCRIGIQPRNSDSPPVFVYHLADNSAESLDSIKADFEQGWKPHLKHLEPYRTWPEVVPRHDPDCHSRTLHGPH